jgi:hypothetical protein
MEPFMSSVSRGAYGLAGVSPFGMVCSGLVCLGLVSVGLVGCGSPPPAAPKVDPKVEAKVEPKKVTEEPEARMPAVIGNGKSTQPIKTKGEMPDNPTPSKAKGEAPERTPSKSKGEFGDPTPSKAKADDEPPAK